MVKKNIEGCEIKINLNNGEWVRLIYSNIKTAETLYRQYKSSGQYSGQWIKDIELIQK